MSSSFAFLARIALKSQHELLSSLHKSLHHPGWAVEFTEGTTRVRLSVSRDNKFHFDAESVEGRYILEVPSSSESFEDRKVVLRLFEGPTSGHVVELRGKDLLDFKAPEAFTEIHAKALDHLERIFGLQRASSSQKQGDVQSPDSTTQPPQNQEATAREWVVRRDQQKDLRFKGDLLAQLHSGYRNGRKNVFSVFKTVGGSWVGVKQGVSLCLNEKDLCDAKVAKTTQELFEFFGYSELAKALYRELGLLTDSYELVD